MAADAEEYLLFRLRGRLYGVAALAVREVHWLPALTPLAATAPYVIGVLNLRGHIVPVIDLGRRLGQMSQPLRLEDSLVVLEHAGTLFAVVVNEVWRVQAIAATQIEPVPLQNLAAPAAMGLVSGVAKVQDEVVMLLHLERLLQDHPLSIPAVAEGGLELLAETAGSVQDWLASPGYEAAPFSPEEQEILRRRALRLMPAVQSQAMEHALPLALLTLGGECYAIELQEVREFCLLRQVSPVPCCPAHIIGQMNLRGDIVTLIDIRPLLQMSSRENQQQQRVVVVQHENCPVGIVVDEVQDVLYLDETSSVAPVTHQVGGAKYFRGSVLHDNRLVYIFDISRLLAEGGLVVDEVVG
jgi:purine-binding chemotaxis protein CheW